MVELELPKVNVGRPIISERRIVELSRSIRNNKGYIYLYVLRLLDSNFSRNISPHLNEADLIKYIRRTVDLAPPMRNSNAALLIRHYKHQKVFHGKRNVDVSLENQLLNVFKDYISLESLRYFNLISYEVKGNLVEEKRRWQIDADTYLDFFIVRTQGVVDGEKIIEFPKYLKVEISNSQNDTKIDLIDPDFNVFEDLLMSYRDGRKNIYISNPFYSPVSLLMYLHELFHSYYSTQDLDSAIRARDALYIMRSYDNLRLDAHALLEDEILPWRAALKYFYQMLQYLGVNLNQYQELKNGLIHYAESSVSTYHHNIELLLKSEL